MTASKAQRKFEACYNVIHFMKKRQNQAGEERRRLKREYGEPFETVSATLFAGIDNLKGCMMMFGGENSSTSHVV